MRAKLKVTKEQFDAFLAAQPMVESNLITFVEPYVVYYWNREAKEGESWAFGNGACAMQIKADPPEYYLIEDKREDQ